MSPSVNTVSDAIPAGKVPVMNTSVQISREAIPPLPADSQATSSTLTTKASQEHYLDMKEEETADGKAVDHDPDAHKGAVEDDSQPADGVKNESNGSMSGQMGHRNKPKGIGDADTDFPEPDAAGEHSGEKK